MINLQKINKYYYADNLALHVLKDVSLHIKAGEFVGIMGESGSGKSTLINILGFIDKNYSGEYLFKDYPIMNLSDTHLAQIRNRSVGFVFQQFNLIDNYTAYENVELPLLYAGKTSKQVEDKVLDALEQVKIKDKAMKYPRQLSGGQQQRVAIARAIVHRPKFIIADEPTGALDSVTSKEIMTIFKELNEQYGITIIMVTHDPSVAKYCTRVFHMLDGVLNEDLTHQKGGEDL